MSKLEARERFFALMLKDIEKEVTVSGHGGDGNTEHTTRRTTQQKMSPLEHYNIAESQQSPINITVWLGSLLEDRATKVRKAAAVKVEH